MKTEMTRPILVQGFQWWTCIPKIFSKSRRLFRAALIFSPRFEHLTAGGSVLTPGWDDVCNDYFSVVRLIAGRDCFSAIRISHHAKMIFDSVEEYEKWMTDLDKDTSDFEAPEQIELSTHDGGRLLIVTEFWCRCGGPSPYSDSYTFSFYTEDETVHKMCVKVIQDFLQVSPMEIVHERQRRFSRMEQLPHRIWEFLKNF